MKKNKLWIGTSWKMNKVRAEARAFSEGLAGSPLSGNARVQTFVIPPFPYIAETADLLRDTEVLVGAQNMHWQDEGAWTGEVSPLMLLDCGARIVEIGHSERRTHFGETDETVAKKTAAAVKHGLIALVCIGDTKAEYDAGRTGQVLEHQTRMLLSGVSDTSKVVIAYEPVWSIGEGGTPAPPAFAEVQHKLIKQVTADVVGKPLRVVYGGSVNAQNCVELAAQPDIDGLFIGRSALDVQGYLSIIQSVLDSQGV